MPRQAPLAEPARPSELARATVASLRAAAAQRPWHLLDDEPLDQALRWMLRQHGISRLGLGIGPDGVIHPQAERALAALPALGLEAQLHTRSLSSLPDTWLPAVLLLRNGDACVLVKRDIGHGPGTLCTVVMPGTGPGRDLAVRAALAEIAGEYSGQVLVLAAAEQPALTGDLAAAGLRPMPLPDARLEPALPPLSALIDPDAPEPVLGEPGLALDGPAPTGPGAAWGQGAGYAGSEPLGVEAPGVGSPGAGHLGATPQRAAQPGARVAAGAAAELPSWCRDEAAARPALKPAAAGRARLGPAIGLALGLAWQRLVRAPLRVLGGSLQSAFTAWRPARRVAAAPAGIPSATGTPHRPLMPGMPGNPGNPRQAAPGEAPAAAWVIDPLAADPAELAAQWQRQARAGAGGTPAAPGAARDAGWLSDTPGLDGRLGGVDGVAGTETPAAPARRGRLRALLAGVGRRSLDGLVWLIEPLGRLAQGGLRLAARALAPRRLRRLGMRPARGSAAVALQRLARVTEPAQRPPLSEAAAALRMGAGQALPAGRRAPAGTGHRAFAPTQPMPAARRPAHGWAAEAPPLAAGGAGRAGVAGGQVGGQVAGRAGGHAGGHAGGQGAGATAAGRGAGRAAAAEPPRSTLDLVAQRSAAQRPGSAQPGAAAPAAMAAPLSAPLSALSAGRPSAAAAAPAPARAQPAAAPRRAPAVGRAVPAL